MADIERPVTRVFTSPPYPNRMSYIRELRPYMYWLGFLSDTAAAGELDWQAIGGTWGRATSNLYTWAESEALPLTDRALVEAVERIEARSLVLGRYVRKYVHDIAAHVGSLTPLLAPGARVGYVIGNSKFYDVVLETERIYADLFRSAGFGQIEIESIRKRTSKRELYEYIVHAIWQGA